VSGMLQVNNEYENTVIWEGITDASGKATFTFNAKKKDKYTYWQSVDDNFKLGKNIVSQPEYKPIALNQVNHFNYLVVKDVNMKIWVNNLSCVDSSDKMRYRKKSLIGSYSNWDTSWSSWTANNSSGYFDGCENYLSGTYTHRQDVWDVEMEVTKNGFTTLLRDTFYI